MIMAERIVNDEPSGFRWVLVCYSDTHEQWWEEYSWQDWYSKIEQENLVKHQHKDKCLLDLVMNDVRMSNIPFNQKWKVWYEKVDQCTT